MKSIIFDTETTGLPPKGSNHPLAVQPHIIEFGAVFVDDDNSIIRSVSQLLDPGIALPNPKKTLELCNIREEMLVGKPSFIQFLPFLMEFCKGADAIIAHNLSFDKLMMMNELKRADQQMKESQDLDKEVIDLGREILSKFPWPEKQICTMLEYTHLNGGRWPKLEVLYEKIIHEKLDQSHRALGDVMDVYSILIKDKYFEKIAEGDDG